jgi:hypothetical protein
MGGAISALSGTPNASEVNTMLNVILREMFQRADLVDLYSLADPDQCSKYLVVAADAMKQLFKRINLEPRIGEKGVLYFQKIDALKKANPLGSDQTEKTCRQLSFFFIRIFHIYGALTLSIMDSELPKYDDDRLMDRGQVVRPNSSRVLRGFEQANTSGRGWLGVGGALVAGAVPGGAGLPGGSGTFYLVDGRASVYKILNRFLLVPDGFGPALEASADLMLFDTYPALSIAQDQLYDVGPPRQVKNFIDLAVPRPIIDYRFRAGGGYRNMTATLDLTMEGNNIDVTLENITLSRGTVRQAAAPQSVTEKLLGRRAGDPNPLSSKDKPLPAVIVDLFNQAKDIMEPPQFSSVEFMRKFGLIRSLDGDSVRIEGASKIYMQSPRNYVTRSRFVVEFADKLKLGDRSQNVEIAAEVKIEKGSRSQYRVVVDLEGIETEPEELAEMLDRRTRSYSTFTADENNPTVQPTGVDRAGETIPGFIQGVFEKLLKTFSATGRTDTINAKGKPKPYESDKIPEEFKVQRIWKALAKNPPIKSHCVARALQLLNAAAIRDPQSREQYSSVCKVSFPYIKDGSLPQPGKPIVTSEGIYAMAMLFVDHLDNKDFMPKITQTAAFDSFKLNLRESFERYQNPPVPNSISDIRELQIPKCQGHSEERMQIVDQGLQWFLRGKANELVQQQMTHVANVMRLIFKLFDEEALRKREMKINANILAQGMSALNALAEEARNVLIAYYTRCEKTYTEGLLRLQSSAAADTEFR